ncbi:hypothetical protein [Streptomyces griseorubiginosus]|uniref:hypothetical protein n=1 Tax=Streptomyces griseorubiginosus TaxID=67304 RepID=UPI002E814A4A|nr:hypothetical protein [Streptomyces griseorubiginosus]WUB42370.1 hypothetical protein OHN19_03115 [Streptomyces griseorubiginosus]WUB50888.1 hypothetical protein OG942_03110 [Streptomyces griseorubiginosus]
MDHRNEGPGENGDPIPRDLPDQQAGEGEDPWEVATVPGEDEPTADQSEDVPDTDEAGTGRQGAERSDTVHPEHPGAQESSG